MAFNWIGLSNDKKTVTLKRLEKEHFQFPLYFNAEWEKANLDQIRIGAVLDVETTGLSHDTDQVIEIGIRPFVFNRLTGEVLSLETPYSAFQDPGKPLSEEVKALTGITDEMLKGQKIEWDKVNSLLSKAQVVIAHNAGFDRPFIDQSAPISSEKIWGCTFKQIDWNEKGYTSSKLDSLSIYHGFFTGSHRALNDSDALLYLLSMKDQIHGTPYLLELLGNAKRTTVNVIASSSPFESKDHLKNRNYSWNVQNKYWSKQVPKEQLPDELKWLEEKVYNGAFKGRHSEVLPMDNFKANH